MCAWRCGAGPEPGLRGGLTLTMASVSARSPPSSASSTASHPAAAGRQRERHPDPREQRPAAGVRRRTFRPSRWTRPATVEDAESIVEYHNMWFAPLGRGEPERVATGVVRGRTSTCSGSGRSRRTFRSATMRTGRMPCRAAATRTGRAGSRRSERHRAGVRDERLFAYECWSPAVDSGVSDETMLTCRDWRRPPVIGGRADEP